MKQRLEGVVVDEVGVTIMMDNVEVGDGTPMEDATLAGGATTIIIITIAMIEDLVEEVVDEVVVVDTTIVEAERIVLLVVGVVEDINQHRQVEVNHKDSSAGKEEITIRCRNSL